MFGLTLRKISRIVQGELRGGQEEMRPAGAAIDSRSLREGDMFFALRGENTDGHNFLAQVREKKAAAAVVDHLPDGFEPGGLPVIIVDDVVKALQQTATAMRALFQGPVVAITGSTGKTTTKDMLWSILSTRGPVLKNTGNYNNELGVPLTILSLQEEHQALVLEMGMRGLGEIDFLARISTPVYGIITSIGHTHQELLGSQERIAQAKAELISHIPASGGMALNLNDKSILKAWLSNLRCPADWVGFDNRGRYRAGEIKVTSVVKAGGDLAAGTAFAIYSKKGKECAVHLPVPGRHNVLNALLALAIARQLGCSWAEIKNGLEKVELTSMRLELKRTGQDVLVINDAYNANPDSTKAALEVLRILADGKRGIAVLGNMYELGDYQNEGHRLVGLKAKEVDAAYLITVGLIAGGIAEAALAAGMSSAKIKTCQDNQEALSYLREIIQPGDVVLVKGSRGMKMEEIAAGLLSC